MTTTLQITVTKDILEKSKYCGYHPHLSKNCAIALAVRDVFPTAIVRSYFISIQVGYTIEYIGLPLEATRFIQEFDRQIPEGKVLMPEISFQIEIPDNVLETINIEEIKPLLQNHPSLKLVTS